ncbi:MAG: hypothetical protein JRI95_00205 [Deltaproteobacteria bacterium]|nr:hypothetical protein [Deltaproteobacteria bacterium]
MAGLLPGCTDQSSPGPVLTVMSYNIGTRGLPIPRTDEIAEIVRRHDVPDILLIQDAPWKVKIKDLAGSLGFAYFISGRKEPPYTNLGILSKRPLFNIDKIRFNITPTDLRPAALCAEIAMAGKTVLLCSVHLASLRFELDRMVKEGESYIPSALRLVGDEFLRDSKHTRSIEKLLKWLETKPYDAAIIGGDFNTFIFTKPIRAMNRRFDDALWPSRDYFRGTYREVSFPIKPRIDFIFHSKDIECLKAEIIRETPGDHYPLKATFGLD